MAGRCFLDMTIALPHLFRPTPMRKRLWQLGSMLAIVTLIFAFANVFQPQDKAITSKMLGHDFLAFYTAGTFVREGRIEDLYDLHKVANFQATTAEANHLEIQIDIDKIRFGPWWNPPFYAWVFVPLTFLPYPLAVLAWTLVNVCALAGAMWLLVRMLVPTLGEFDAMGRPFDWKTTGLVPFLLLLSMPFVQAIGHGQNTMVSLFILSATVALWRSKRAVMAGAMCALLGYKPQLAAVVACVLVASLGWRALFGLVFVGSGLVLVTQITLPGALVDYLYKLPANVHFMQVEHAYHLWDRHATLKGFWRLLLQGQAPGELSLMTKAVYYTSLFALAGAFAWTVCSQLRQRSTDNCWDGSTEQLWRDRLIAATICSAPLLMPFYFDYDLLLLAIPAVLFAGEQLSRSRPVEKCDTWLQRGWILLYANMLINPPLAGATRVNFNVVLLVVVSVFMIRRAYRVVSPAEPVFAPILRPATMTRKAA